MSVGRIDIVIPTRQVICSLLNVHVIIHATVQSFSNQSAGLIILVILFDCVNGETVQCRPTVNASLQGQTTEKNRMIRLPGKAPINAFFTCSLQVLSVESCQ